MAISDYSTTPASNTSLSGIDISGTTGKVKDGDNAIRQLMADIKAGTVYLSATSTFLAEATDAGATAGPILDLYRNSATPANADILGKVLFNGEDSGGGTQEYASIEAVIVDVTAASEDGQLDFYVTKAGARTKFQSMTATATAFTGAAAYTFDGPLTLTSTDAGATAGPVLTLYRDSATPAASDILGQVLFNGEDSAGNTQEYASVEATIVSPTSTTETGALDFYVTESGARTKYLSLTAAATAFTGAASYTFDAGININGGGAITALLTGTYTPTLFNTTNVAASTAVTCTYLRVGDFVTVFGVVLVDATAAASTLTELGMSLPIASAFSASFNLAGTGQPNAVTGTLVSEGWSINADTANDRAIFRALSQTTADHSISFTFGYRVI